MHFNSLNQKHITLGDMLMIKPIVEKAGYQWL